MLRCMETGAKTHFSKIGACSRLPPAKSSASSDRLVSLRHFWATLVLSPASLKPNMEPLSA